MKRRCDKCGNCRKFGRIQASVLKALNSTDYKPNQDRQGIVDLWNQTVKDFPCEETCLELEKQDEPE